MKHIDRFLKDYKANIFVITHLKRADKNKIGLSLLISYHIIIMYVNIKL